MGLCWALKVMLLGLFLEMVIGIDGRPTASSRQSLAMQQARDYCYRSGKLTESQRLRLDHMAYENEMYVHRYVRCFWMKLQLWGDDSGFNAMRIVNYFGGPRRLDAEQAVLVIGKCNSDTRRGVPLKWCYRAFSCVLKTPVGEWFRRHMSDVINGNA